MSRVLHELRHAARGLVREPAFTILAVLTLGLGIGATTAIFSLVHGIVVSPLPYPDPERLVYLDHSAPGFGLESDIGLAPGLYVKYRESSRSLESVAFWRAADVTLTGRGEPQWIAAAQATSELFPMLGARVVHGRLLVPEDDAPDSPRVALLSHGLWQARYGGDPGIVGDSIEVAGTPVAVVGVLAADFRPPAGDVRLWMDSNWDFGNFGGFSVQGVGRVREGFELADVRRDLDAAIADLGTHFPGLVPTLHEADVAARPVRFAEHVVGDVERTLWILLGTVGFVMLAACANVANLFLVRAEARSREVAVRRALGAGRWRLARHFLAESLSLSLLGGGLGVAVATLGVRLLVRQAPVSIPRLDEVGMDAAVLGFALALALLTGLVFGLVPVLGRAGSVTEQLRDGGRAATVGKGRVRARQALVVAQLALALVLLGGAGLLTRSFVNLRAVDPGFDPEGVLSFRIELPHARYPDAELAAGFQARLLGRLRELPAVEAAGAALNAPLGGRSQGDLAVEEGRTPEEGMPPLVWYNRATEGFFETLRVPLLAGRLLEPEDRTERTGAIVINRAMAERFWAGADRADILGRRITNQATEKGIVTAPHETDWLTVVGVVGDTRQEGLTEAPRPMLYAPLLAPVGDEPRRLTFVLRAGVPPLSLVDAVRETVRGLDPELPLIHVETLRAAVRRAEAPMAFTLVLVGIAAGVAILLGIVGVYGVIAYVVRRRAGEIGVRMALGARGADVLRMLLGQGAVVTAVGLAVGLGATVLLVGSMEALLFGVEPLDPLTHVLVAASLFAVALLATWLPARRASRIDPLEALREE